jgi:hypothetical protein
MADRFKGGGLIDYVVLGTLGSHMYERGLKTVNGKQ